jgi:hypothetical protein
VTSQTTATSPTEPLTAEATARGIVKRIADELGVRGNQVAAAVELLDGGATVPFIARYRKEVTGTLDDAQLRTLDERLRYLRELEERRAAILASIEEQGKLTDELRAQIDGAETKARLEDLYLPCCSARPPPTPGRRPSPTSTRTWPTWPPPSTAPARSWSSASPRTPT